MNLGVMDEEDDIDPALAEAAGVEMPTGRPNVPRNPDDPREKIKQYLMSQEKASQLRQDPAYRAMERAPAEAINESNRSIDFAKLLNQSANQFGSLGGKVASSAPLDQFSKGLKESNQNALGSIMGQRQAAAGDEDRQLKIKQYLADKYQSSEDQRLRRDELRSERERQQSNADRLYELQKKGLDLKEHQRPGELGLKEFITDTSKKNAGKAGILSQIQGMKTAFDAAKTNDEKIRIGRSMIKVLNSTEGQDAVGAEEAKRLADALEYKKFNMLEPGPMFGYDLKGFDSQVNSTMDGLRSAVEQNQKNIDLVNQKGLSTGVKEIGKIPEKAPAPAAPSARKGLDEMTPEELDAELAEHQKAGRL